MTSPIRLRRHTDGRLAVFRAGMWLITSVPPVTSYPSWFHDDRLCSGPGWSELLVAELPEPDGHGDVVGDNGENAQAPWWYTKHGTYTAWHEGVEDDWGLQEDETLDDVRSDALKMLAAVTACEQYRAERET